MCPGTLWVPPGGPTTKWISAISSLLNMTAFLQRTNEQDPYIQCHQCNIMCCLGRQHNRAMHKRKSYSPLSDGGIQALPVTSLNGVVVADVLLLVLLNSRGCDSGQFFGRKQLSGHFTNTYQLLRGGFHDRGSGNLWQNTPDIHKKHLLYINVIQMLEITLFIHLIIPLTTCIYFRVYDIINLNCH